MLRFTSPMLIVIWAVLMTIEIATPWDSWFIETAVDRTTWAWFSALRAVILLCAITAAAFMIAYRRRSLGPGPLWLVLGVLATVIPLGSLQGRLEFLRNYLF